MALPQRAGNYLRAIVRCKVFVRASPIRYREPVQIDPPHPAEAIQMYKFVLYMYFCLRPARAGQLDAEPALIV